MKSFNLFLRESSYTGWKHEDPVKYSKHLTKTFGNPDELTNYRAVWYAKDGVKRIEVKDEYILHGSPAPHYDFVYSYIDLKVPHEIADELADSSESIMIDFLKNEVGARCGSLTANAVTLNYVLDVVAKRVRPSKEEYEKRIKSMISMFDNKKIYSNDWWPDETKDADPKNPYYKKGSIEEAARIPRKPGQPANSKKHSDLYTDENPRGTIQGLKFASTEDAERSIRRIKSSGRKHAHKIQAAIAMEQRAKVAGKASAAAVYRKYINKMKEKTKSMNEERKGLYYYINKKRKEGRPMRKKGAKGAPKPSDFERAKQTASEEAQPTIGGVKMKKLGKGKPGSYKSLVSRHLGASAAEKIDKSDGAKLVSKGKRTGNTDLVRKGNFIKNVIAR